MASLEPSKPEPLAGCRNALTVKILLYRVGTYLNFVYLGISELAPDEPVKIAFVSTLLGFNTADWWYMTVQSGKSPGQ